MIRIDDWQGNLAFCPVINHRIQLHPSRFTVYKNPFKTLMLPFQFFDELDQCGCVRWVLFLQKTSHCRDMPYIAEIEMNHVSTSTPQASTHQQFRPYSTDSASFGSGSKSSGSTHSPGNIHQASCQADQDRFWSTRSKARLRSSSVWEGDRLLDGTPPAH